MFTCEKCDTKGVKSFSKKAYRTGVVLIRCEGCDKLHLIADNLGWFRDEKVNIEDIAREKGKSFLNISDHPDVKKLLLSGKIKTQAFNKIEEQKIEILTLDNDNEH